MGARLLILTISCAVCLGVAEATMRWVLPVPELQEPGMRPGVTPRLRYVGSIFSRNVIAPVAQRVEAGDLVIEINDKGYRGPDFSWQKDPESLRITVYGGSAAFDPRQNGEDHWPARLQRKLAERDGPPVEVINAGTPGHASFDSLGRFIAEGHRMNADLVLLYHAWNDLKYFGDSTPILRQYRSFRAADELWAPRGRMDAALGARSHLYRLARIRFLMWDRRISAEGQIPASASTGSIEPIQLEQFALTVASFVDAVRNSGGEPVLVTQARLVDADNTEAQRERIAYRHVGLDHDTLLSGFAAVDGILRRIARHKGVMLVDASAGMTGIDAYFVDHVHLAADGSDALASLLADALEPLLRQRVEAGIVGATPPMLAATP